MSLSSRLRRTLGTGTGIALGLTVTGISVASPVSLLGTVAPAQAATGGGSIVYVKDHDVWITDGDGRTPLRVTTGGTAGDPWQSPTQSDDGVVVAHRGGIIYRMNQRGEVLNTIDPPALPDALGNRLEGRDLTETAISPDGTKIAYTYFKLAFGEKRWVTAFTSASKLSDFNQWGLAFYDKPAWVTDSRVVLNSWYRNKTHLYDLGQRDLPWFDERFYANPAKELSDLEVSRDGQWTVGVRGDVGDESVIVLHNDGDVLTSTTPATPDFDTQLCNIGAADGSLHEPTIAPDGSTVAWAEPGGIYRASDMSCDPATTRVDILVAAGGSDPSWSPAVIGRTPDVPRPPASPFQVKAKPRVLGTPVVGRVLSVRRGTWAPAPKAYHFRWTRDGKPIAQAVKSRYRLTKRDRGHRIAVKVTVARPGWKPTTRSTGPVRVRR